MRPPISEVKELLGHYDLKARKSLGQHFLVDRGALRRIVAAAELTPEDVVIEIGPGLGVLTRELARAARRVVAVEADEGLAVALGDVMAQSDNVAIVNADALQVDPCALVAGRGREGALPGYKVVANIPYYITSPILRHFLEARHKPSLMVVMVQREVGESIVAKPGGMSILAVSVQFYGKPAIVGRVHSKSFYPSPKVDSVILRIEVHSRPPVSVPGADAFFQVVRAGFSAPRKQLRNSLAQGLGISAADSVAVLERAKIDPKRRAETLDLQEWARVCQETAGNEQHD